MAADTETEVETDVAQRAPGDAIGPSSDRLTVRQPRGGTLGALEKFKGKMDIDLGRGVVREAASSALVVVDGVV